MSDTQGTQTRYPKREFSSGLKRTKVIMSDMFGSFVSMYFVMSHLRFVASDEILNSWYFVVLGPQNGFDHWRVG